MKKVILSCVAAVSMFATMYGQSSDWSRIANASIGVGIVDYEKSSPVTFTQQIGVQWKIKDNLLIDGLSFSAGFALNNAYGGGVDIKLAGSYDYSYNETWSTIINGKRSLTNKTRYRSGYGTADASLKREDLSFMPTASLNYAVMPRLEVFATLGLGVGVMHTMLGDYKNATGFSSDSNTSTTTSGTTKTTISYSYNDLDHAEWEDGKISQTKVCFALAFNVGARYWLNDKWGLNANVGLVSANIKKSFGNSYNLFSVGASYKF